jgi:hypothetical protein
LKVEGEGSLTKIELIAVGKFHKVGDCVDYRYMGDSYKSLMTMSTDAAAQASMASMAATTAQ